MDVGEFRKQLDSLVESGSYTQWNQEIRDTLTKQLLRYETQSSRIKELAGAGASAIEPYKKLVFSSPDFLTHFCATASPQDRGLEFILGRLTVSLEENSEQLDKVLGYLPGWIITDRLRPDLMAEAEFYLNPTPESKRLIVKERMADRTREYTGLLCDFLGKLVGLNDFIEKSKTGPEEFLRILGYHYQAVMGAFANIERDYGNYQSLAPNYHGHDFFRPEVGRMERLLRAHTGITREVDGRTRFQIAQEMVWDSIEHRLPPINRLIDRLQARDPEPITSVEKEDGAFILRAKPSNDYWMRDCSLTLIVRFLVGRGIHEGRKFVKFESYNIPVKAEEQNGLGVARYSGFGPYYNDALYGSLKTDSGLDQEVMADHASRFRASSSAEILNNRERLFEAKVTLNHDSGKIPALLFFSFVYLLPNYHGGKTLEFGPVV